MKHAGHVVAIVVDPGFGDRVADLLERMPVWMADTEANQAAAARARTARVQSQTINHTAIGSLTTFTIDRDSTPESWCLGTPWLNTDLRTPQRSRVDFERVHQMASQPDRRTIRNASRTVVTD
jgi:hypothetical protein